jgi:hypothetical protein
MKKIFFIFVFILLSGTVVFAQDDGVDDNDRMQDKLKEYIQKRLGLTRNEANRFGPVFGRYLLELRKTHREFADPLIRQQRIAELRLRYRDEMFRPIMGEQRAGKVFIAEKEFREHVLEMLRNRRENLQDNRQKGRIRGQIQ